MTLYMARGDGYDLYIYGGLIVHVWDGGGYTVTYNSGIQEETNRRLWETDRLLF